MSTKVTNNVTPKQSLQILHNLVLSLVSSLLYMVALVAYIKGTQGLTLDVHHEAIMGLWSLIIILIMMLLESFDKRGPKYWLFGDTGALK